MIHNDNDVKIKKKKTSMEMNKIKNNKMRYGKM